MCLHHVTMTAVIAAQGQRELVQSDLDDMSESFVGKPTDTVLLTQALTQEAAQQSTCLTLGKTHV